MTPAISALLVSAVLGAAPEAPARHRLYGSFGAGAQAYLSDTRTMGGIGPTVGVRDIYRDLWVFEADASYLMAVGNVFSLRAAAGIQRPGIWAPAATVGLTLMMGDRFSFMQPGQAVSPSTPTLKLDLVLSPLRFWTDRALVSVGQLGIGIGSELPGFGMSIHLGILEVAIPLG